MAQLHYGDLEARRQLADVDPDRHQINVQGEGYGVFSDEHQRRPPSPTLPSSDAPLQVHHERKNPFSIADESNPLTVPPGVGNLPVTTGYGNLDLKPEESTAGALPVGGLPGPVGPKGAPKEEGTFDPRGVPKEEAESMAKELEDPFARNLPATSGYESLDAKLDEPRKAFPGGVLDESRPLNQRDASKEESMVKEFQQRDAPQEEFQQRDVSQEESMAKEPSRGLDESSFNQKDASKEEPIAKELEQRDTSKEELVMEDFVPDESFTAGQRGPSKELEDQSAERGGLIDVHGLKDDFVDLSGGNITKLDVDNQPSDVAASHRETGKFTSEVKSAGDDPKQEQTSQIDSPVDDDLKQEGTPQFDKDSKQQGSKPCPPRDDSQYGCQSFEGEDGRKKISVESFNVYSGEPEKVVYDAADVMDGQPESGANIGVDRGVPDLSVGDVKVQESEPRVDENENVPDSVDHGVRDLPEGLVNVGEVKVQESEPRDQHGVRDLPEDFNVGEVKVHESELRVDENENENVPAPREGDLTPLAQEDADIAQELEKKPDMRDLGEDEEQSQKEKGMDAAVIDILAKGEMPSQAYERPDGDVPMPGQEGADTNVDDVHDILAKGEMPSQVDERPDGDVSMPGQEGADTNVGDVREVEMQPQAEQDGAIAQELDRKLDVREFRDDEVSQSGKGHFESEERADIPMEQQADSPRDHEDKATIADVKSDDQAGIQVRNLDQPGLDDGVGMQEGVTPSKDMPEMHNARMVQVRNLDQPGLDEGVGIGEGLPPSKDVTDTPKQETVDEDLGPQDELLSSGVAQVRNLNQSGLDEGVGIRKELPPPKDIPETPKQEREDEGVGPQDELLPSEDIPEAFKQEKRDEPKSAEAGEDGDEGSGPRDELLSVGIRKELPPPKEIPETPKQERGDEGVGPDELLPSKDVSEIFKQERGDVRKSAEPGEEARDIESPLEFKELPPSKDIAEPQMGDESVDTLEQERADKGVGPQEELLPSKDMPEILKQERGDERKSAETGEEARDIESPLEFKELPPSTDIPEPPKQTMGDEGVGTLEQERGDEGVGPQDELLPSKEVPEILKQARDIESPLELKELPPPKDIPEPPKQKMGDEGVGTLEQEIADEGVGPQDELLPSKEVSEILKQERGDELKRAEPGEEGRDIESPLELKEFPPSKDIPETPPQKMGDEGVGTLKQERADEGVGPQDELLPSSDVPEIPKQKRGDERMSAEPGEEGRDIDSPLELEDKATVGDVKSDYQTGMRQVRNVDQPVANEGVDTKDELLLSRDMPGIFKQDMRDESRGAGQGEERNDTDFSPKQMEETTFGDMKSDYPRGIAELRDIDQPGADAGVVGSLEKPVVDADLGAQEEESPVRNPELSTADPGMVPLANVDAAPVPIIDVDTQEESPADVVVGPPADVVVGPPADKDVGHQDESLLQSPVQPPADVGVGPLADKDAGCQDEAFLRSPDQPIADVDLDVQEEESPVRNPDQPIADAGMVPLPTIGVATPEELLADVGVGPLADEAVGRRDESLPQSLGQPIADAIDGSKGAEQAEKRELDTHVIDEEQKGMAKGGEQFILNAPVVDYNARNLPVEQDAELKLSTENRELHPNAETANVDSPYTEFDRTGDYVKEGYGAEGFLPTNNEDVERKLRVPVDQEKGRRQLDERPVDKTLQLDEQGKFDERVQLPPPMQASELYKRPATLPHPQPEDLAGIANNGGGGKDVDRGRKENNVAEHDEGHHHKKGVFERIKEKLTPPFGDHHSH